MWQFCSARLVVARRLDRTVVPPVVAGGVGGAGGTWPLAGHSLTLRGPDGRVTRGVARPLDNPETPAYPGALYFGGTTYLRRSP